MINEIIHAILMRLLPYISTPRKCSSTPGDALFDSRNTLINGASAFGRRLKCALTRAFSSVDVRKTAEIQIAAGASVVESATFGVGCKVGALDYRMYVLMNKYGWFLISE